VNKASLWVVGLAVGMACAAAWKPSPRPAQPAGEISKPDIVGRPKAKVAIEAVPRQAEAVRPEATTIVLPPRTIREQVRVTPPLHKDNEPLRLVRDLQRELKRAGCYFHDIDGDWTPATRKAMQDFSDRVNAVLPVEKPDPAHLALVQGQPKIFCGDTCPAGESLTDNRCLPSSLSASAVKKTAPTPPLQLTWMQSYPAPSAAETEEPPLPAVATPAEPPPRARRRTARPGGFGSLLMGIFSW
jgi:hypothetical protein